MTVTLGEYRVGMKFNPSGDSNVYKIKLSAADFIDVCAGIRADCRADVEVERLWILALARIEEAAMWAVKAATKPEFKEGGDDVDLYGVGGGGGGHAGAP